MDFQNIYLELTELKKKIKSLKSQGESTSFFNVLKKMKLTEDLRKSNIRYAQLKQDFDDKLDVHLRTENTDYLNTLEENRMLLTKNRYNLQVHSIVAGMISSTELRFKGYISPKGYLYLNVDKTNIAITNYSKNLMSKLFIGGYDEYGSFTADSVKMDFHMFLSQIPKNFRAKCDENYLFRMEAEKTEWEISGNNHVETIIGDPFNSNSKDRTNFLKNREKLLTIKSKFLNKI